jgi:hypothetical protein
MVDKNKITTIKLDKATKARLDKLKISKNESYDEVIQKILHILNICKVNPLKARTHLKEIDRVKSLSK